MISRVVLPTWQFDAFEAVSQLLVRHESLFRIMRADAYNRNPKIVGKKANGVQDDPLLPKRARQN